MLPSGATHDPPLRRVPWAVLLIAMALLAFQLVLTRLFSVILWNHFAFLAISVGMLGFGMAGVAVFVLPETFSRERAFESIRRAALALPPVMAVVVAIVCALPIRMDFSGSMFGMLAVIFGLTTLPFFVGGLAITLALTHWPADVNRVYAFDLVGSAIGCGLVIGVLEVFDGPTAAVALGVLPALAALVLRRSALAIALLALVVLGSAVNYLEGPLRVKIARSRVQAPLFERWNAFSRVTVSDEGFMGWGLSETARPDDVESLAVRIDADALTPILRFDGDLSSVEIVLHDITSLAYHLKPNARKVVVIGPGGGKDVLAALVSGAEHVRAVELNPIIARDIVGDAFREFTGDLYRHPAVELVVGEGRSVVRRDTDHYDVVQISMVDTSAASAAGAYALTENSLYTSDAAREFLERLEPGGVFTTTWVNLENLEGINRLVAVYAQVLRDQGLAPEERIAVVAAGPRVGWIRFATLLVMPSGFSAADVARLREVSGRFGYMPLYLPGDPLRGGADPDIAVIRKLLGGQDLEAFYRVYRLDLRPVGDDRPFFFYQNRFRDLGAALTTWDTGPLYGNGMFILAKLLLISAVAVLVFMLAPLAVTRRSDVPQLGAAWPFLLYFFCLGMGFIVIEIALVQLFGYYLGHPLLGLGVSLAAMLLMTGFGSGLGARWSPAQVPGRLRRVLLAIVAVGLVDWLLVPPLVGATLHWPTLARVAVVVAVMVPLGLLLGLPLPSGLRLLGSRAHLTPWMWATNGGASVFGATLATLLVIHLGFSLTIAVGAATYGVAVLALHFAVRSAEPSGAI